jgi:hypothetical protein
MFEIKDGLEAMLAALYVDMCMHNLNGFSCVTVLFVVCM